MAIVVEEEKKSVNWVAILAVAFIVIVLFVGSYYLFFKNPELIEIVAPKPLQDLKNISKLSFNPETVINSPTFKLLKRYDSNLTLPTPGRNNPFKPF